MKFKNIVIGAGISGITIAQKLSEKGEQVLIIEKRDHIGGNSYDYFDSDGCYVQKYGPHIFHTSNKKVWDYVSRFTKWHNYQHKVLGFIDGNLMPIPFNFDSIDIAFPEKIASEMKDILVKKYGYGARVSVFDLINSTERQLKLLGDYVYQKVFLNYTIKQWDQKPDEIDKSVLNRVPVIIGKDPRYFSDSYQGIPEKGFTEIFRKMLDSTKIKILLNTDYKEVISYIEYESMFYTGPLDYFFDYKFGNIKYRAIDFEFEKVKSPYQKASVVNYPNDYEFTRITEFGKFLENENANAKTVILREYPSWDRGTKAYPVKNSENQKLINRYLKETKTLKNTYFLGRLAECKYYNMDQAFANAIEVAELVARTKLLSK